MDDRDYVDRLFDEFKIDLIVWKHEYEIIEIQLDNEV